MGSELESLADALLIRARALDESMSEVADVAVKAMALAAKCRALALNPGTPAVRPHGR